VALTREEIKAKRGVRPREAVDVPELGGTVYVAKFSAKDRDRFEEIVTGGIPGKVNLRNVRAQVATLLCVNEDGTRLFDESDAEWLGDLDTDAVQKIIDAGFRLNGIKGNAIEAAAGESNGDR
jgi:hypothetical protein